MYYLYILKSTVDNNMYIGSTNDLRRRLSEHNKGRVLSTKLRRPLELRYYEAYSTEAEARHREHALKNNGRVLNQLKKRIYESLR